MSDALTGAPLAILGIGPDRHGVGDHFDHLMDSLAAEFPGAVQVRPVRVTEAAWPLAGALALAWRHRHAIRRADAVHVEFGSNDATLFLLTGLAARLSPRVLGVLHDAPEVAHHPAVGLLGDGGRWRSRIGHRLLAPWLDRRLVGWVLGRLGAVAVLGPDAAAALSNTLRTPAAVLPHGAPPRAPQRTAPGQAEAVLFAGFLGPRKGLDVLLEAWTHLTADLTRAHHLIIASDRAAIPDPASHAAAARADQTENPPHWVGAPAEEADLEQRIADAAVVVLPYRRSSAASGILVRALGEGRPVIASAVPAATAAIRDDQDGLLVPPGDVPALTRALERLLSDPPLRDRLGAAAARRAEALYSNAAQAEVLHHLYRRLAQQP